MIRRKMSTRPSLYPGMAMYRSDPVVGSGLAFCSAGASAAAVRVDEALNGYEAYS